AEPHLAYDCSALALRSLKSQSIIHEQAKANKFPLSGKLFAFILPTENYVSDSCRQTAQSGLIGIIIRIKFKK
ncbi:MAG: hypothetical protein L0I16_03565, partial [Lacticaseibacillus paracasei]|nr:hypothetical protein [Lacticaseibacillus paracasei]